MRATKSLEKRKKQQMKKIMTYTVRSIGIQTGESVESVVEKKKEGCGENDLWKRKALSLQ